MYGDPEIVGEGFETLKLEILEELHHFFENKNLMGLMGNCPLPSLNSGG